MRLDKIIISVFMALALLVLVTILIFSSLKTTHFNIRLSRPSAPDRSAEIRAASQARVDEMRPEAWAQMSQAYAQSVVIQAQAQAEAKEKTASAEAMATRSMALLPWMGLLLVALVILVILFRRQPAPESKSVVLVLPPGASRQDIHHLLANLQPDQVKQLPAPGAGRAIVLREDKR